MLPEQMAPCHCQEHKWKGNGGYVGGDLAYSNFRCDCGRSGMEVSGHGCGPLGFVSPVGGFTDAFFDYLNDAVLVQWRSMEEEAVGCIRSGNGRMSPLPPKMPDCIDAAYRMVDKKWEPIIRSETKLIEVPPDPIRLRHDEYWNGIFIELRQRDILPESLVVKKIKNQYYNDRGKEAWFTFELHGAKFIIGPRKRVVSISVEKDTAFKVGTIAELAKQANTSYWADGRWHSWEVPKAREIEVHAWKREDVISYLQAILGDLVDGRAGSSVGRAED